MSNQDLKRINKNLENGIIPPELNFSGTMNNNVDWEQVRYNAFYKSADYFLSKFPPGFENLPGVDNIIEDIILNSKSPLEEMKEREKKSILEIWEDEIKNLSINNIKDEQSNISSPSIEE